MGPELIKVLTEIVKELQKYNLPSNNLDFNSLISALVGAIAGGVISWLVTRNGIQKQYDIQRKLMNEDLKVKEKRVLLILKDEIGKNHVIADGFMKYCEANNTDYMDTRKINNSKLEESGWGQYKGEALLLTDYEFAKQLTQYYQQIYFMNHTDMFGYSEAMSAKEKSIELSKHIDMLLMQYEKGQ